MSESATKRRLNGLSHVAINCSDMAKTVEFYEKLGIPLVKTMTTPQGSDGGQHFFFDIGNDDSLLGYIWWNDEAAQPSQQGHDIRDGCMHHVAINIHPDDVQAWWDLFSSTDLKWVFVDHKADAEMSLTFSDLSQINDDTFAASFYVQDPDGVTLEFTAWYKAWDRIGNGDQGMSTQRGDRTPVEWVPPLIDAAAKLSKV
jgi:catechol 2,3-dioxygenase-like lactoylglutathione lyase family enzyme